MWNEMSWDRMPGTGTEVPTIGEFLAGNPVPHLVPHDMSVTLGVSFPFSSHGLWVPVPTAIKEKERETWGDRKLISRKYICSRH